MRIAAILILLIGIISLGSLYMFYQDEDGHYQTTAPSQSSEQN
ncbi:MAG: hypothetical protein AAF549_00060 [Pseudomonadota bacterium]